MSDDGEHIHYLNLAKIPPGSIGKFWMHIVNNAIGEPIRVPIMVARGIKEGPILGLTAAIHGNELNGISVIQELFRNLNPRELTGTIIGVLVVNVPGLLREQRGFINHEDLNRITPGKADGNVGQVYIYRIIDRILRNFDLHIDLHTASFGRRNSYYIRADMDEPRTARMARLQNADIIVHNPANDQTLRGAADGLHIPSITVELRDPHLFQDGVVEDSLVGINNVIYDFGMLPGQPVCPAVPTLLCRRSYWLYTDEGGILEVLPRVRHRVKKGELVARVSTIFGKITKTWNAPEDGVIVGRSVNPLNQTGSRIVHLGVDIEEVTCVV